VFPAALSQAKNNNASAVGVFSPMNRSVWFWPAGHMATNSGCSVMTGAETSTKMPVEVHRVVKEANHLHCIVSSYSIEQDMTGVSARLLDVVASHAGPQFVTDLPALRVERDGASFTRSQYSRA
jgi:hypothetical protein